MKGEGGERKRGQCEEREWRQSSMPSDPFLLTINAIINHHQSPSITALYPSPRRQREAA